MHNKVIVLTGTIEPGTTYVSRRDVQARISDYLSSFEFYLSHTTFPILFAENSTYNLHADPRFEKFLADPRFTVKRFVPHPDSDRGKGFQEFYMLDQLVELLPENALLVKITGRYIVRNIASMMEALQAPMHIDLHQKRRVAITGFFSVQVSQYLKHITGLYANANDEQHRYIEHVLYDVLMKEPLKSSTRLLPENPVYEGISGSHGASLARNPYKMMVRSLERRLLRSVGINRFLVEY